MRLLIVTPRFRPDIGGVEHHVEEVGRRLVQLGCQVTVLTTGLERSLPAADDIDGVVVRRVRAWPRRRDYYLAPRIFSEVAAGRYDVVHVQSYHTLVAPIAMFAAVRQRLPYVVTFHGGGHSSRVRNRLRRAQFLALRPLLARADRLVATARFEIEHYGRLLGVRAERFVLIPNGSDFAQNAVTTVTRNAPGPLIASVGRLERYKGHQRVLAALPHVLQREPHATLWIAGAGPYEKELRRLAAKLGVADRVLIEAVPSDSREAMAARLAQAAVVVLLSERETHPMAALEAVSLGRPLVVADTPGLQDLADDGIARAIELHSEPAAVATVILEEAGRPDRSSPLQVPSWDDCAAQLLDLYRAVLRERHMSLC
jgi:glycosyltransferase involved in cell wall biosynthesis